MEGAGSMVKKQIHQNRSHNRLHTPVVSVVIPVFNGAQFLEAAVASVLKSTYRSFEILLIDDGSSDTSKKICRELTAKYPKIIRFFPMPQNKGLGRVLNFALKNARGKYIARLNQDDLMLSYRLGTQVKYLNAHPSVVVVGSWNNLFDEQGNTQVLKFLPTDEEIKKTWLIVSPFSDPTTMYRKDVAKKVGGYIQDYWPADDTQLWYRMGMAGKLANIQKPLVNVRWHKGAGSVRFFRRMAFVTYRMHRWAHESVQRAPWHIQAWWIIQFLAGITLTPQMNWSIYWQIKKLIATYADVRHRLGRKQKAAANATITQPIAVSRSGVYRR
jgi:glycosyltransferase involved in cell wall biosynthesis